MVKKLLLALLLSLVLALPVYAGTSDEVTTFGYDDERNRDSNIETDALWPAYEHKGGASYSQPLLLKGERWGLSGKTIVIAVEGNKLNGFILSEPGPELVEMQFKPMEPVWSVDLSGEKPTTSHPTLVERDGKTLVYIGAYAPYFDVVDITDFNQPKNLSYNLKYTTDVTSAPLLMDWNGHQVVVMTSGNTGKIVLAIDPYDPNKYGVAYINVGSGRTSSSPAPLSGNRFAIGLDQGPNSGELRIYSLDDLLGIDQNDKVYQKGQSARVSKKLPAGLVASFCVDGDMLYFGDCASNVYGYNTVTNTVWGNSQLRGTFSYRSPALSGTRVYFPATGREGEPGSVIAIDRATGKTAWVAKLQHRVTTAPVITRYDGGASIMVGTEKNYIAIIDASTGKIKSTVPVSNPNNQLNLK